MERSNNKKICIFILAVLLLGICTGTATYIYSYVKDGEHVTQSVSGEKQKENVEGDIVDEDKREMEENLPSQDKQMVDFDVLQMSNPDILAWIRIQGTKVDYPIAQHSTDDEYYLKHGPDGMSSSHGCPYIELSDSGTFQEFNTVIYGHNMNDGSMFADLHKYEDLDFYEKHRTIDIYLKDHSYTYTVFAAVMFNDKHIPYYYNDTIESDRTAFLNDIKTDIVENRSYISDDIDVTEDDYIITLSTCDKKLRNNRYLVVAVLTKIDGQDV